MKDLGLLVVLVVLIVASPFVTILALNKVFHLGLAFDFGTWASVAWLQMLVVYRNNDKSR